MARIPSAKTKALRKMGQGEGGEYRPYITTSEFNSMGTTAVIRDWKTGRQVHCLSQGEALWYYILRWDDNNLDIREQYPLDKDKTNAIADAYGFRRSCEIMTLDFLVTTNDGLCAYSVKANRNLSNRTLELLTIQKTYMMKYGIQFKMLFKEDVNELLANNIRRVTEFYDKNRVFDKQSMIKHLIATKQLMPDLENTRLEDIIDDYQLKNRN